MGYVNKFGQYVFVSNKSEENRESSDLDKSIRSFRLGEISASNFIANCWNDSWDSLIAYVNSSGFNLINGRVPYTLLSKQKEYNKALINYYLTNPISIEVADKYFPTVEREDIRACLNYLIITKQISSLSVEGTIAKYLAGELPEIKETPKSKDDPRGKPEKYDWLLPYRKKLTFDRVIREYYRGEVTCKRFVERFSGTWEDLIDSLVTFKKVKSKEDITPEFLAKKEEFEKTLIDFYENEYCELTQINVNGEYVKPTIDDVHKVLIFFKKNNISMGKARINQTISKYLRGEIDLDILSQGNQEEPIKEEHIQGDMDRTII